MARKHLAPIQHLVSLADPTIPTPSAGDEYFNSTYNIKKVYNGAAWTFANEFILPFTIGGTLSVGVTGRKQRVTNHSGSPWLVVTADLHIDTGPLGGSGSTLQVNSNGSIAFSVTVASGSNDATSSPNFMINNGDYLDVDVTVVGSTVAGADATLTLSIVS
jgi:hypothetical protein